MSQQNQIPNINTWIDHLQDESRTALSIDCVIFGYDLDSLKILLINCDMPPHIGKKSLIGDLVRNNESLDDSANRILKDITGLENLHIQQVKAFGDPNRHPLGRVITVAYYSLIKIDDHALIDAENRNLQWIDVNKISTLAFDHLDILHASHNLLKQNVRKHPIGFQLLPKKFTLQELQSLYETILGVSFDKRNFRRKLNAIDILLDLNEMREGLAHRPAKLYSFNQEAFSQKLNKSSFKFEI